MASNSTSPLLDLASLELGTLPPLTLLVLCWNSLFFAAAALANLTALCVQLNSWPLHHQRRINSEKLGYFLYLFLTFVNLVFLALVKLPLLHRDWQEDQRFAFGDAICQVTLALRPALGLAPHVTLSAYLASVWLRLRRRPHPGASQHATSLGEGALLCLGAGSLALTVGLVVTYQGGVSRGQKCTALFVASLYVTIRVHYVRRCVFVG